MRIQLLGVPIDAMTRPEALMKAEKLLWDGKQHLVTTPNPEMLVLAARDAEFKAILGKADLSLPDGVGLLFAAKHNGLHIPERVSGADFMVDLVERGTEKELKMYLLGGNGDAARLASAELRRRFPGADIVGAEGGGRVVLREDGTWDMDAGILDRIRAAKATVLFVAFGHGKQERWIVDHLALLPTVRIAMGVGGSFDFLAGRAHRAPKFMRALGLEWLWRLVLEPWRIGRIWTAVVTFTLLALRAKK